MTFQNGFGPDRNQASNYSPESALLTLPSGQSAAAPPAVKGMSYFQLAWSHKFILIAFVVAGTIAGTVYDVFKTPVYQASATVELVGFNQSFMGMNQVDPQANTDSTTASASNISTQVRVLTSRSLLTRVLERMNLEVTPVTSVPVTPLLKLRNRISFLQEEPLVKSREAIGMAARSVSARGVGSTRLIEIHCTSTSPEVAATFVNTLAAEHLAQSLAARSNLTQRTSQWMDSQLEEAKARLQQAGEKLRDFVQKSGMDFFPEQSTLADTKMKQLQSDVSGIQADRISKQARWELAKSTPNDVLPSVISDPNLQSLKSQLEGSRREMAQLTATLTPEHYKVKRIQAQITETEQTLEKEKSGVLKRLQSEYEEAMRKEKLLSGAYNSQTHAVSAQADKAAQYSMFKRDVEMEQQLYNSLLQQSNQAALIALAPTSSVRVVDAALPNSIAASPRPSRDIPTSAFAGGVLGYGLLWLRELARRKKRTLSFDTPGHTTAILGVPELGVIPSAVDQTPKRSILRLPMRTRGLRNGSINDSLSPEPDVAGLLADQSSLMAESFRQTLVSLLGNRREGHNPVYVITSAGPGEGKTTLSANLASAMAEIGHRVLLVDADLRRPHLHALFGSGEHLGLSDILTHSAALNTLPADDYLQATKRPNLKVMTHGVASVDSPGVLFFSPRVKELVDFLQPRFDYILFDTAPAIPFPDARLWGKFADGVVLIVRAGVTTREGATTAIQRFQDDGIPVLGTILNDWTPDDKIAQAYYSYHGAPGQRT